MKWYSAQGIVSTGLLTYGFTTPLYCNVAPCAQHRILCFTWILNAVRYVLYMRSPPSTRDVAEGIRVTVAVRRRGLDFGTVA